MKTRITVSCGVAEAMANESMREWLNRCDQALYKAKQHGRNHVEVAVLESAA